MIQPIDVPVIRSQFSVAALATVIEHVYGLNDVHLQLIKGTIRDTYRVDSDSGRSILSIYRHELRTLAEIGAELDLLAYLDAHGAPVAPALPQRDGTLILPLAAPEGTRFAALFRYVEGTQLSKTPRRSAAHTYGRAIAQIHTYAEALPGDLERRQITVADLLEHPIQSLALVLPHNSDTIAELRTFADVLRPQLTLLPTTGPQHGLIHGDVIPSNAQVARNGRVTVLDFDFCGYGWRAYDIATYLMEAAYWHSPADVGQAFLDGYSSVRSLTSREIAALPALEAARAIASLGTPAQHINIWGSAYLSDDMIESTLSIVRKCLSRIA